MMTMVSGSSDDSYDDFYNNWKTMQKQLLDELQQALESNMREPELRELLAKVERHYGEYYHEKDFAAKKNVLEVMQPSWKTPLENAFLWIGGWRPTMVFQLAYAQAGQQIEVELAEFLDGLDTPTMASLSAKQLQSISNLQQTTHKSEEELGHRMAVLQQGFADQPLLTLAQAEVGGGSSEEHCQGNLNDAVDEKVKALEELLLEADKLRFSVLTKMLKILNPIQATQFLVAAAQLQICIQKIGQAKQEQSQNGAPGNGSRKTHD